MKHLIKPELCVNEAKGFRDVYWCWLLNEPVIVTYRDGSKWCTNCDGPMTDESHAFVCHIEKPASTVRTVAVSNDPWEPIETVPADVRYIDGSDNGKDFRASYTRVEIDGKAYWQEYDYLPSPTTYEGRPKFWRRSRDYHGRDMNADNGGESR